MDESTSCRAEPASDFALYTTILRAAAVMRERNKVFLGIIAVCMVSWSVPEPVSISIMSSFYLRTMVDGIAPIDWETIDPVAFEEANCEVLN